MEYIIIAIAAAFTSGLTLFSGFGLGTLLMPAFALFFPIEVAIATTAIVHFLNNLLKLKLLGKHAEKQIVLRFGIPAILAAFLGAWLLTWFSELPAITQYQLAGKEFTVLPVKVVIAALMIVFAFLKISPRLEKISFSRRWLPLGGFLSGFF